MEHWYLTDKINDEAVLNYFFNQVLQFYCSFFDRVQVRRTDKINTEAAFHSIEEYMYWVELYYKQRSKKEKIDKKRVFLATDDPTVLPEAEKK